MLAYVGLMLTHVEPKDPKNGNSKKTLQNAGYFDGRRPILGLCWPILGLCWPILRAMLAHLGTMLAHLGAMLAHLGAMLAHLGAMLAHLGGYVGPCWPILNHKIRKRGKNAKSTKHRKTRGFLAGKGVGGRGRGPSLLRRGEKRLRQGHGQGAPGRI